MDIQDFKKINIPEEPGVYFFKHGREILYIGKATSLKDRVRSYFTSDLIKTRGLLLVDMVAKANSISFETTGSVLEALLKESALIKKYQPYYNTKEKDNKSYYFVAVTDEEYPAVVLIRGRELEKQLEEKTGQYIKTFGPFVSGSQLKEAMGIIRKIFPYRDLGCKPLQGKPCFNASIGLCPGVCTGKISSKEYQKQLKTFFTFMTGDVKRVQTEIEKKMLLASKRQHFEEAGSFKKKLYALGHIQDIALLKKGDIGSTLKHDIRIESYDIAHMAGKSMVGVMVVSTKEGFQKDQYRIFNIKSVQGSNDPAALREVLERRFEHAEWDFPRIVIVDGNEIQQRVAYDVIQKKFGHMSKKDLPYIVSVVKDDKHKARAVLSHAQSDIQELSDLHVTKEDIVSINAETHRFAIQNFRKKQRKDVYL